jgi:hypothetical protein
MPHSIYPTTSHDKFNTTNSNKIVPQLTQIYHSLPTPRIYFPPTQTNYLIPPPAWYSLVPLPDIQAPHMPSTDKHLPAHSFTLIALYISRLTGTTTQAPHMPSTDKQLTAHSFTLMAFYISRLTGTTTLTSNTPAC